MRQEADSAMLRVEVQLPRRQREALRVSELQLGLLGIGILVVIGVLAYNKLQEARLKRQSEEAFGSRHDDVLLGGGRTSRQPSGTSERIEPTFSAPPADGAAAGATLDPSIDFIATLELSSPVAGEAVSAAIVDSLDHPAKAVGWEGYNPQTENWEALAAAGEYLRLRAGIQLADRNGAVSEQDLSEFSSKVQALGESIGAKCTPGEVAHFHG